ncbi:LysR family transcriptional regulator substrate-binding protein [Amycolatopsis sp. MtRt-6]|uniref:LysR family transcriptional regulator substrate-binding protein n=1 Tax=Amycolatopsis sp. MtRt-6 TaxID=2792782 RepID=UPI0027DBFCBB|nr:LysR family transcriptional regulator substrate-binding protein [Amycolatopsis sp. MtRt-6]
MVRAYRRRPGAADVEVVFTRDHLDVVRAGSADVAVTCGYDELGGLEFTELVEEETVALLPRDHPLAAKPAVSAGDVAQEPLFRPQWPDATLDEIIDQVAMGELIVIAAASATDRIGSAVVAVPVADAPPTWLMLTWRPDIPAATRDEFVHTAKSVAAGRMVLSAPGA